MYLFKIQGTSKSRSGSSSEAERTTEAKDKILTKALGEDPKGRVRCMGEGLSKKSLKNDASARVQSQVRQVRAESQEKIVQIEQERERERQERELEREEHEREREENKKGKEEMMASMERFLREQCRIWAILPKFWYHHLAMLRFLPESVLPLFILRHTSTEVMRDCHHLLLVRNGFEEKDYVAF
ncbi:hypothetical protein M9H77_31150 [Catharanthus roseus]|uniref:Uncharacterized protein n=1 Tax=Catharanthus roseus TaxID=4058 RepID=A0ACC0A3I7_CATRO|nr:hypothetical protein M9H77_31150 [Catharanthus roseus]